MQRLYLHPLPVSLVAMGRARAAKGREKVSAVLEGLEEHYGRPVYRQRFEPMDELVSCILTQHTTDATAFAAFDDLRARYPTWHEVVQAGPERVANVVRRAGLANQKAKNIVAALSEIKSRTGDYDIGHLASMSMREARAWLQTLPGVGPKTASIVLSFSFGMGAIPVDTHVYRVSTRLGLLPPKTDANKAHDVLLDLVEERDAYRFHVLLIQHGRQICKAQRPKCHECNVLPLCPFGQKWVKS
jgi:endonuclease-3